MITAIQLVIAGVLLAASYILGRNKLKQQKPDSRPTTLTNRGEILPMIIGTRRIGPMFSWAGDRSTRKKGGGGSFGGSPKTTIYHESGWHALCVGPATSIVRILIGTEVLWDSSINRSTTPSGSVFTPINRKGSFTIYWGEEDQPPDAYLSSRIGYTSKHKYVCYIVWKDLELGTSATWPNIEYVVTCQCPQIMLSESSYLIEDDAENKGVNLAHALAQILVAKPPHGIGLSLSEVDNDSLEALGVLMESEQIGVNLLIQDGPKAVDIIRDILQDAGVLLAQVEGRLVFYPLRDVDETLPLLGDDLIIPPDFERTINRGENPASKAVFVYKDQRNFGYKDQDIVYNDDGEIGDTGYSKSTPAAIVTVTAKSMAEKIASRRWQEAVAKQTFKVSGVRGARRIVPGMKFSHENFPKLVVLSNQPSSEDSSSALEVMPDTYSIPEIGDTADIGNSDVGVLVPGGDFSTRIKDLGLNWFELPETLSLDRIAIVVFRIRANAQVVGAEIVVSVDGSHYHDVGNQDQAAAGGLLTVDFSSSTDDVVEVGPVFEDFNGDVANVPDLTGDTAAWQAGKLLAVINEEIFFLRSVTIQTEDVWEAGTGYTTGEYVIAPTYTGLRYVATSTGTTGATPPAWPTVSGQTVVDGSVTWEARHFSYRLNGLIRSAFRSGKQDHSFGDRVFIIEQADLVPFYHPLFAPGATVTVKSRPFTTTGNTTESYAIVKELLGLSYNELATNFRTSDDGDYRVSETGESRASL